LGTLALARQGEPAVADEEVEQVIVKTLEATLSDAALSESALP
jgi:hypothetical protein